MFPQSFYKKGHAVSLRRTAHPTGILSNPLDLINHPRPWLTVETSSSEEISQKKILVFADHFYSSRSQEVKDQINAMLNSAQSEGFDILILSLDGLVKAWDGSEIPLDYALPLETFTKETISTLTWVQHHLNASSLFFLDYFGINELIKNKQNEINFAIFKDKAKDFPAFISTAPCETYSIVFSDADELLKFLEPTFIQYASKLESIKFIKYIENFDEFITRLPLLPQLKKISFTRNIKVKNIHDLIEKTLF